MKYVLSLLLASIVVHFAFFGNPGKIVFDELYFSNFVSSYQTGNYYFDTHPPLGKLLIAGSAYLGHYKQTSYLNGGDKYPDPNYIWLRILPLLCGTLLPLIIFYLCRELKFSSMAAFLAGTLTIIDNSLLIQSRFALLDLFLLFFGFSGILLYLFSRRKNSLLLFAFSVLSLSAAFSIKWTGLSFIGMIFIIDIISSISKKISWKQWLTRMSIFIVIPVSFYILIFAVHFHFLPNMVSEPAFSVPTISNEKAKVNSIKELAPVHSLVQKTVILNKEMYDFNKTIPPHMFSSPWYTWPLTLKPVLYFYNQEKNGTIDQMYFVGNPTIYWSSALAVLVLLFVVLFKRKWLGPKLKIGLFLLFGYALNFIPFAFIRRPMFLYHYLSALVFAIMILTFVIDELIKSKKYQRRIFIALVSVSLITFGIFSFFTYGIFLK